MLQSILLALDGQGVDHASSALAQRWAARHRALLAALAVVDERLANPREIVPIGAGQAKAELDQSRLHEQLRAAENDLSLLAIRCAARQIAFKPLEAVGQPAESIAVEAQRFDLIVLPRQLHDGLGPASLSISQALRTIICAAPRPVISVADVDSADEAVMIAYDGSLQAARTLQLFVTSGLGEGRSLHVVSLGDSAIEAACCGDRAVEFLASHDLPAKLHASAQKEGVAKSLIQRSHDLQAGLVVLGAYGQPRIKEFVLGSVTCTFLSTCPLPLFLYH